MEKKFSTRREIPWLQRNFYQTLVYVLNLDIALFPPWNKKNSKNNNNNNPPKNHSQLTITQLPPTHQPPSTHYSTIIHHQPQTFLMFHGSVEGTFFLYKGLSKAKELPPPPTSLTHQPNTTVNPIL